MMSKICWQRIKKREEEEEEWSKQVSGIAYEFCPYIKTKVLICKVNFRTYSISL
jgi:hypothetical protein